jgi:hypothetical protein
MLNDNTCFLTLVEKYIREQNGMSISNADCFTCRIIEPVYDFEKNNRDASDIIYAVTLFLWVLGFTKLYNKWSRGEIKTINDLAKL